MRRERVRIFARDGGGPFIFIHFHILIFSNALFQTRFKFKRQSINASPRREGASQCFYMFHCVSMKWGPQIGAAPVMLSTNSSTSERRHGGPKSSSTDSGCRGVPMIDRGKKLRLQSCAWIPKAVQRSALCRSRPELSNA